MSTCMFGIKMQNKSSYIATVLNSVRACSIRIRIRAKWSGGAIGAGVIERDTDRGDVVVCNALIRAYAGCEEEGMGEKAVRVYESMQKHGLSPDRYTFPCLLKACASLGPSGIDAGRHIHAHIKTLGLDQHHFVANAVLHMYASCAHLDLARQLFDIMTHRSVVSWNVIIAGYVKDGQYEEAFRLFYEMQLSGISPSHVTVLNLLPACTCSQELMYGKEIHAFVIREGLQFDVRVANSLLDTYLKCASIEDALKLFSSMPEKDVVSWNVIVSGFNENDYCVEALYFFQTMQFSGFHANPFTFSSVIAACGRLGSLRQARELHGHVSRRGFESHVFVAGALIDAYSKSNRLEEAENIFYRLKQKDVGLWNSMIVGYTQGGQFYKALQVFAEMIRLHENPSLISVASILPACIDLAGLKRGMEIHNHALKRGLESEVIVANALIDMYAKCGDIDFAYRVFKTMPDKSIVSWNAMILAYGKHGLVDMALSLFFKMQGSGFKPDHMTFLSALYSCSHSGLSDEGWQIFESMKDEYNLVPNMEHYACMVDLLGRVGKLEEAYGIIRSMPFEADSSVWETLLSACRIHSNIRIAELAADQILKSEP